MKLLTIIGARPQIIKAAALSRAIRNGFSDKIQEKILHTGQHYDENMSAVFFAEMNIPKPDFNLNIGSGRHGEQTAKMIAGIEQALINERFDAVVLYGDTNSTLAGAVAASKLHIPIVHIEAGLRSFNMAMPEEINRIVCDQLSTLLFAPTQTAVQNLTNEGFMQSKTTFPNGLRRKVFHSGDIMYDNSLYFAEIAEQKTDILERLQLENQDFVLCTIHRDNNTDNPERLSAIIEALLEIAQNTKIVLPLHPRTKKLLPENLLQNIYSKLLNNSNIQIIPPASFFEIIVLEKHSKLIMTDSGGLQKEAYFFRKPCIILRPETEWVEIVQQNAGKIADANKDMIIDSYHKLLKNSSDFMPVFGDGQAAEFMLNKILETFN
ncbi:MAG: UDP-N-acetylglucosamine 2-epimerase (non-hydrolyzing) [Prevotellaceae bacterium]|jgi:UDP-GlcNAc3NAcA epimerase|nr:UDP-N-acetylglucosamine 2-epimerase (non-hydrolyzing) [Prevotellaceae bacterium]